MAHGLWSYFDSSSFFFSSTTQCSSTHHRLPQTPTDWEWLLIRINLIICNLSLQLVDAGMIFINLYIFLWTSSDILGLIPFDGHFVCRKRSLLHANLFIQVCAYISMYVWTLLCIIICVASMAIIVAKMCITL